ncbi:acyl-CoA dehydrogenase family protein [Shimia marina]|uniref:Acyl-CoA dehydrogenase n=1 Tax=Shimia marina TaxID=321267 RepID=A0A0P1FBC9_9RHOB|nr:acyl-CoA dehydrogenase family protein [Shimia marina]CUH52638.1 Acyl-CoA dehydrogenase [Shimia marina]SFE68268.1 Acyl-CoA dehydrogenase [Shimia marina]
MEVLSEDHKLIAEAAQGFLKAGHGVEAFRALRDAGDDKNAALRSEIAGMGWMGILLPEAVGGVDFGYRAAGLIAEAMGRNLTISPFLSSAILAATVLRAVGGTALQHWGPRLAEGQVTMALALEESTKHRPDRIATTLAETASGLRLTGRKGFVVDGGAADRLIVVAKQGGACVLVLVDPAADGVVVTEQFMLDHRNAATVAFEDVALAQADVLAMGAEAEAALAQALAAGRAVAAAEQLGVAKAAADQSFDYLRTRKQFGVLIGQFQALQHRAADLYCELAQADSLVAAALNALDAGSDDSELLTRAAKAKLARVGRQATEEGVQMHGGIGMTDAMDLGLFMKRDRALSEFLGDAGHHTDWILRHRGI